MIYDGIVDDEDIAAGVFESSIPSGSVTLLPQETSAEGVVVFDVPQAWAGRSIRRMRWEFRSGRLTKFEGDAAALALRKQYEVSTGDRDRISSFTIGTNTTAALGVPLGVPSPPGGARGRTPPPLSQARARPFFR